ncbi:MAG: GNAT family N-acetyltransferase [Clostridiales bacterium]|nr:GNAT family N-acetyltransferase [Clostridiales bacterium]
MIYQRLKSTDVPQLLLLMQQYKKAIGEPALSEEQTDKLKSAIAQNKIEFFGAKDNDKPVAMCSIGIVFSTFLCEKSGIFEDFFIAEEYRHKGIARDLTSYVFEEMQINKVATVWVGCAAIHVDMYKSLGFSLPLGTLRAWSAMVGGVAT